MKRHRYRLPVLHDLSPVCSVSPFRVVSRQSERRDSVQNGEGKEALLTSLLLFPEETTIYDQQVLSAYYFSVLFRLINITILIKAEPYRGILH